MMIRIQELLGRKNAPSGPKYWRSLDQLSDTPEFRDWLHREFPAEAAEFETDGTSRRKMLQLMGASFALAGLTACRRPVEHVLPMAKGVEDFVHGRPLNYATAMPLAGVSTGLLVEVNDGRPTKIEGNPDHPASQGAAGAWQQASVLGLYDPDRSKSVLNAGREAKWDEFAAFVKQHFAARGQGEKLRIVSERINSPSLEAVKAEFSKKFPQAKWIEWEPAASDAAIEGASIAFGAPLSPVHHFDRAEVILSLDDDFLGLDALTVAPAKGFSKRRRVESEKDEMNRLYVVESQFSITGAMADHRLRLRASEVQKFAADLAAELQVGGPGLKVLQNDGSARARWLPAVARDLARAKGKSLVIAGPRQPAAVHALAYAINQALGNAGETVTYLKPSDKFTPQLAALHALSNEMQSGQVDTLVVLGANPAFTAPADFDFANRYKNVATTIHCGIDGDETALLSKWHVPMAHYLESWGDGRSFDGTVTIQQPMIQPLFGGKTAAEVLAPIAGYKDQKAYDIVRNYWLGALGGKELAWRKALNDGVVPNTKYAELKPAVDVKKVLAAVPSTSSFAETEVAFYASSCAFDGRFINNGWLQEAPEPMTKLTWDNAALVSPATARKLGVVEGDMIAIERSGSKLEIPVVVQPGHADNAVSVALGYGRTQAGSVGKGVGFNAYAIRHSDAQSFGPCTVKSTGARHTLARTVDHHPLKEEWKDDIEKRLHTIVREGTVEEYRKNPKFVEEIAEEPKRSLQLYPEIDYSHGNQWGMAIDLNSCIGCNACVVACQAENNNPVVGKEQVLRGREMHWIRLDRYYTGKEDDPRALTQPLNCQQCENAPCENVCPVAATTHSPEGLNDMAYNRCVGTRYCSNNCPYKVRRFNFFNFHKNDPETVKMVYNPDVTVRMRGVMEKCTYCVQRIQEARIHAKIDGRRDIRDGEAVPACAQTCPADAIAFGNINDKNSRVARIKAQERNYSLLGDLYTKPRTTYLAKLRNPNPELEIHG